MNKLPNFFLVGAVKAGTTAFYNMLKNHPDVYMSPIKEPNFFSQADMQNNLYAIHYRRSVTFGLSRYLKGKMNNSIHIADVRTWEDYCCLFKNVRYEKAIGEASNSYLFCPSAPSKLAIRFPEAKILMILRNPVERAWSHYLMNRKLGHSVEHDFQEEFQRDTDADLQGWGVTSNYYKLGLYAEQLQRFLTVFPRQKIKVILYDDFRHSPGTTLTETFKFLAVEPKYFTPLPTKTNSAALPRWPTLYAYLIRSKPASLVRHRIPNPMKKIIENVLFTHSNLPELGPSVKRKLIDLYDSDIGQLSKMLGRNLDHWYN